MIITACGHRRRRSPWHRHVRDAAAGPSLRLARVTVPAGAHRGTARHGDGRPTGPDPLPGKSSESQPGPGPASAARLKSGRSHRLGRAGRGALTSVKKLFSKSDGRPATRVGRRRLRSPAQSGTGQVPAREVRVRKLALTGTGPQLYYQNYKSRMHWLQTLVLFSVFVCEGISFQHGPVILQTTGRFQSTRVSKSSGCQHASKWQVLSRAVFVADIKKCNVE
jgi:hypothetical protein